jgi:RimJ/RimL family protein N-acetyltransferase
MPFAPDWPLETERLVLRAYRPDDFHSLHELYSDETVVQWLYEGPATPDVTRDRLDRCLARRELTEDSGLSAAVTLPDGTYVGGLVLWYSSFEHRGAEVGYTVSPHHQGQGYACESTRALLDWAFTVAGVHRVVARLEQRNVASARVAEKLGMRREATFLENEWVKGEWQSEAVYAILDREWAAL